MVLKVLVAILSFWYDKIPWLRQLMKGRNFSLGGKWYDSRKRACSGGNHGSSRLPEQEAEQSLFHPHLEKKMNWKCCKAIKF